MPKSKIYNFHENQLYYTGTEIFEVSSDDPLQLEIRRYVDRISMNAKYTDFIYRPNDREHSSIALIHAETKHICDNLIRFLNENSPPLEPGKFPEFIVPDWEGDYPLIMDRAEHGDISAKEQLVRLKDCAHDDGILFYETLGDHSVSDDKDAWNVI
jgi:hypothetical protein